MTFPPTKYTHIIWDWNGTLMDDAWLTNQIMNGMLSRRGLPTLTPKRYAEIFDFPVIDYYRRAGWDFSKIPFETLSDEFIAEYSRRIIECPLRPNTIATLRRVTAAGLTQSVLSAAKQSLLDQLVDHYQVTEHFVSISGINDHHAAGKVEMAKRWLADSGRDPRHMLMIGDTVHDLHVAEALGVDCILIYSGHMSRSRLAATGARVIDTLDQLEF
jgi:phosphoglycolate phosphatase